MDRRSFLKAGVVGAGATFAGMRYLGFSLPSAHAADGPYGPLQAADPRGIALPAGFTSRVVATSGQAVPGTSYTWHAAPDGGACFPAAAGGWVYVSNSELGSSAGGAGALRFNADRPLGLPDPVGHQPKLRRRRHPVGNLAVLRGERISGSGVGVRPHGRRRRHRPLGDGIVQPRGGRVRSRTACRLPHRGCQHRQDGGGCCGPQRPWLQGEGVAAGGPHVARRVEQQRCCLPERDDDRHHAERRRVHGLDRLQGWRFVHLHLCETGGGACSTPVTVSF